MKPLLSQAIELKPSTTIIMKRLILTSTLALLMCLNAAAAPVIITGNGHMELLGSQFSTPDTETLSSYLSWTTGSGYQNNDVAYTYDGGFSSYVYSSDDGQWDPFEPQLPLGTAFFYRPAPTTLGYTINNPGLGLTSHHHTPLTMNQYYALSSTAPLANATYQNLMGYPAGAVPAPNSQTFLWTWSPTGSPTGASGLGYWDAVYRYRAGVWKKLQYSTGLLTTTTPSIPLGHGAFVGWFSSSAGPVFQSATPSGSCPPNVTLTLTFTGEPLDPIAAATVANYKIYKALPGCASADTTSPGGLVQNVSLQWTVSGFAMPVVHTVVLTIAPLQTQPCDTYFVSLTVLGSTVLGVGGSTITGGPLPFTPFSPPPCNDEPYQATPLVSGSTAYGSLTCADATPAGTLSGFPAGSGAAAKDVWYSFTPADAGTITVSTCQPLGANSCNGNAPCPNTTDTALSVYTGNPGTASQGGALNLIPFVINQQDIGSGGCGLNSLAAFVKIAVHACTTYYIRVAGKATGTLPGDFAVLLNYTPMPLNGNNTCPNYLGVSANSSTAFTVPAGGTAWYRFKAPPGSGATTWLTEVETCQGFPSAVVTVTKGPACPGTAVAGSTTCSPTASFSFQAVHDQYYFVRIDNPTASTGCGFLHVASGIPTIAGTTGTGGQCTPYRILGAPTGVAWSWSLSAPPSLACPAGFLLSGLAGPVTSSGHHAIDIAIEFASKINAANGNVVIAAATSVIGLTDEADLTICIACPSLVLKVGPNPGSATCWVQNNSLPVAVPMCNFNPDICAIGDPDDAEADCNGNGVPDYLDILLGTSADVNGDGIPDECQGCIGVAIDSGPDSTIGNLGGTATLAVHPVGSGPFSYQWRKDGTPLPGENNASLVLNNLPPEAAGLYDAIVTNACGQITSPSAVLFVDPQPVLNVAQAGTNVVLSWSTDEYHLQANPALDNAANWADLPGTSPVTVPIDAQVRYFRLMQNP